MTTESELWNDIEWLRERVHKADGMAHEINLLTLAYREQAAKLATARRQRDAAVAELREVEWVRDSDGKWYCPSCQREIKQDQ